MKFKLDLSSNKKVQLFTSWQKVVLDLFCFTFPLLYLLFNPHIRKKLGPLMENENKAEFLIIRSCMQTLKRTRYIETWIKRIRLIYATNVLEVKWTFQFVSQEIGIGHGVILIPLTAFMLWWVRLLLLCRPTTSSCIWALEWNLHHLQSLTNSCTTTPSTCYPPGRWFN